MNSNNISFSGVYNKGNEVIASLCNGAVKTGYHMQKKCVSVGNAIGNFERKFCNYVQAAKKNYFERVETEHIVSILNDMAERDVNVDINQAYLLAQQMYLADSGNSLISNFKAHKNTMVSLITEARHIDMDFFQRSVLPGNLLKIASSLIVLGIGLSAMLFFATSLWATIPLALLIAICALVAYDAIVVFTIKQQIRTLYIMGALTYVDEDTLKTIFGNEEVERAQACPMSVSLEYMRQFQDEVFLRSFLTDEEYESTGNAIRQAYPV